MVRFTTNLFLSVLAVTFSTALSASQIRIIGGRNAPVAQYPYFVQLERGCGGSLIAADLILTAAHCFDTNSTNRNVRVNVHQFFNETRLIVSTMRHPLYNRATMEYDLLIARIDEPVKNITYAEVNSNRTIPFEDQELTVIGMGSTSASSIRGVEHLQEATIYALPEKKCSKAYGELWMGEESMLCAGTLQGGVDSCRGDSGGPLMSAKTGELVGVVSVGHDCGDKDFPGVYARLSTVIEWIMIAKCTFSTYPFRPPYCPQPSQNSVTTVTYANSTTTASGTVFDIPAPVFNSGISLQLEIFYDLYAIENKWELRNLDTDEVIDEQPYYTVRPDGLSKRTYNGLEPGNYSFEIFDFAKDGICCRFGDGYIRLTQIFDDDIVDMDNREIWYMKGNFTDRAGVIFHFDPVHEEDENQLGTPAANPTGNSTGKPTGNSTGNPTGNSTAANATRANPPAVLPEVAAENANPPVNANNGQQGTNANNGQSASSSFTVNIP